MRPSNPALSEKAFTSGAFTYTARESMTIEGAVNRTVILLVVLVAVAS